MPTTTHVVEAFFQAGGAGVTGLSPTVDIIRVSDNVKVVTAGAMVEVSDGFYKFDFTGFDHAENYVFAADAGVAPPTVDSRLAVAEISETREQIADAVWEELHDEHTSATTMGGIARFLRLWSSNKKELTKNSATSFTWVIFEDDGSTPAFTVQLTKAADVETRSKAV